MAKHTRLQVTQGMAVPTTKVPSAQGAQPASVLPAAYLMPPRSERFGFLNKFKIPNYVKMAIIVIIAAYLIYRILRKSKSGKKSEDLLDSIATTSSRIFL